MHRRVSLAALGLALGAGCADDATGAGEASSSAGPAVRSATVVVDAVTLAQPLGRYARWRIRLAGDAPGTPCAEVTAPAITIDVYTGLSSAPRGLVPLSRPPPVVFPAASAFVAGRVPIDDGAVDITAAASTRLVGTLEGRAILDGSDQAIAVAFDAPTCAP